MKPTYEELEGKIAVLDVQLKLSEASERAWETTMMHACGEDGPKSVADKFAELQSKCAALAAESLATNDRLQKLIQIISNADNDYCMCGDAMKSHVHGGCGHPTGMFDYHYNQWLESDKETPATDAFLAEVRAQGVEMVIAYHRERAEALHHVDRNNAIRHSMAALDASDVATQLRQEAAQ